MEKDWLLPDDLKQDFLNACKRASETKEFDIYKTHPAVNCIVENTTEDWAKKIKEGTGLPFPDYTPNEVRYAYTWVVIHWLFDLGISYRVVEIGGGYGGMCESIFKHTFNKPYRYTIFDLPQVSELQFYYLCSKIGKDFTEDTVRCNGRIFNFVPHDLCIAWCSWSELTQEAKISYIENVMVKAKHLFISSNWDFPGDLKLLNKYFPDIKTIDNPYLGTIIYK